MSKRKYKVGDVVRTLIGTDTHGNKLFPKGTIGTITVIQEFERLPYRVETDKNGYYYSADMIEPVDDDGTLKREMTREEVIERLKSIKSLVDKHDDVVALREAIKAVKQEPCEDAISRQAALDEIISRLGISGEKYLLESERYIYQIIKDLPPVTPKQRWIPVSERLPSGKTEDYLACCSDGYISTIMYDAHNGRWLIAGTEVVAWMPLPEPYKTESEGKDGGV